MQSYSSRLADRVRSTGTAALVGIDPRFQLLPGPIVEAARRRCADEAAVRIAATEEFCCRLIDVVSPLVPAVKPQVAFFEQLGPEGMTVLSRVIRRAREAGLVVIADAKRGDIGSTAAAYADAWLSGSDPDRAMFAADALTINPYLGSDSIAPFFETAVERGAGLYVLVRTSNPGAADFQDRRTEDRTLFSAVADMVEGLAESSRDGAYGQVGAVVGATWPEELIAIRKAMPHSPFLIPGYGSQGGSAADVVAAIDAQGHGALINSSRGINFAHSREPFATEFGETKWEQAVEAATHVMIADLDAARTAD